MGADWEAQDRALAPTGKWEKYKNTIAGNLKIINECQFQDYKIREQSEIFFNDIFNSSNLTCCVETTKSVQLWNRFSWRVVEIFVSRSVLRLLSKKYFLFHSKKSDLKGLISKSTLILNSDICFFKLVGFWKKYWQ